MDVEAIIAEGAKKLGFEKLKDKQIEAVIAFVGGSDVFVSAHWVWEISYLCCASLCIRHTSR